MEVLRAAEYNVMYAVLHLLLACGNAKTDNKHYENVTFVVIYNGTNHY